MICLGNGDLCTKDPTTLSIGSGSELSADNPKNDCTLSHRRFAHTILRFRTCDDSEFISNYPMALPSANRMRVPLDSPPSNTSLRREGPIHQYISPASSTVASGCVRLSPILTSFPTGYSYSSGKSHDFQLAAANFPLSSMNFRASSE